MSNLKGFKGFPEGKSHLVQIPEQFFTELLPQIDDLNELYLTLYVFWRMERMEGAFRYLRLADFLEDERLMNSLAELPPQAQTALEEALGRAVERGALLQADLQTRNGPERYYFVNSPKGRAALRAIQSGQWQPGSEGLPGFAASPQELPNIFKLYEENIGPLTPLIADALKEAEETYPAEWIADAMRIAVEKNKRVWRYVAAILERWNREGRDVEKAKPKDRRDAAETRQRYVEGEFSDFIEH
jgi:DNA replication protein